MCSRSRFDNCFSIQNSDKCLFQIKFPFFPVSPATSGHSFGPPPPQQRPPSLLQPPSTSPLPTATPPVSPPLVQPSLVNPCWSFPHPLQPVTRSYVVLNMFSVIVVYRNKQNHFLVYGKITTHTCWQTAFHCFFRSMRVYKKMSVG